MRRRRDARRRSRSWPIVSQVAPVLLVDRPVELVLVADLRRSSRGVARSPSSACAGRARQRPDPDEDEDREPEEDRDEQEQPADDEAKHLVVRRLLLAHLLTYRGRRSRTARARPGSACSPARSSGTRAPGSLWTYGTTGRNFITWIARLLVQLVALREVRLRVGLLQQVEQRRVVEPELVVLLRRSGRSRKLAGSPKSPVQPSRYSSALPALHRAEVVRAPRRRVERDLEARLLEARAERLGVLLRVRHVRPRDARRIPEVDRHRQRQARLLEQLLRLGRVVRVRSARPSSRSRRPGGGRNWFATCAAAGVERLDDRVAVEAVRDRLADERGCSIGVIFWLMPT